MITLHRRLLLQAALSFGLALCAGAPARAADAEFNFDFANAQNYLGFGTQVWLNNKNTAAATQLLRDLNARYVRVSLAPKIPLKELRAEYSVEQFAERLKANDNPEQRQRFTAFRDQLKSLDIEPVLIFWRMPEPWVDSQAKRAGAKAKANFAKPQFIDAYVNLIVAQMLYSTQIGIAPVAVELTNEPHGAWSTKFTREDYATLAQKARTVMDRYGLQKIRIAGPGTGLREFDHFIGGLTARNAASAIGFASVHVYTEPARLADAATPGMASFVGRGKFGPVLVTEFGVRNDKDDSPTTESDVDASSPEFGLAAGAEAILLLGNGANGLIYWQLQDFNWQKKTHGMMNEAGERRPVAHVMQALFSQLPRGAKVAGARSTVEGFYATAMQADGKTYLMLANLGKQPQGFSARFQGGAQSCSSVLRVDAYVAGAAPSSALREPRIANCRFQATIAPGSAATVTLR